MVKKSSTVRKTVKKTTKTTDKNPVVEQVRQLAWTGQHAKAIDLATQTLSTPKIKIAVQMSLLDLLAESYIAIGKLDLAMKDAKAMKKLGTTATLQAQALNRLALVQTRMGDLKDAIKSANAAVKTKHNLPTLRAESLFRLAEAQWRTSQSKASIETAQKAIAIYQKLGDNSGAGRTYWAMAFAFFHLNRAEESRHAAQTALELCKQAGDQYGVGNALNALSLTDVDLAENFQHLQQAQQAFESAGYSERQAVVLNNLAINYGELGLYSHVYRLQNEMIRKNRVMGTKVGLTYGLGGLVEHEVILGLLESARVHLQEFGTLVTDLGDPSMEANLFGNLATLAFAEGDLKTAIHQQKSALKIDKEAQTGREHINLTELAKMHLAAGNTTAALKATTQATDLHRAQNFARPDGLSSQAIWWRHVQALNANKKTKEAHEALNRAYDFLLESITNIRDAGLRRNALNKVEVNRKLLQYWVKDETQRKLPKERLFAHLAIESNLREPFQRLADTGLRLNALHTLERIQTFLVEEATELIGGERVMLILEKDGAREVAVSILPLPSYQSGKGYEPAENPQDVLKRIGKYLDEAKKTRTTQLTMDHRPSTKGNRPSSIVHGLARIVAPLIAQNQVLGYLYVDMDSLYGSFDDTDRDMLGMLANQGAVALDNAGLLEGLERKVEERTEQLNQRVDELAILNSVGEAMAKTLDVKTVTRIVGDKVRDIFKAEIVGILLLDEPTNLIQPLYNYDQGEGGYVDYMEPFPLGKGLTSKVIRTHKPLLLGTLQEQKANGVYIAPDMLEKSSGVMAQSTVFVPIIVNNNAIGAVSVANYKQNYFSENDVSLLQTLSANMGVAIQNARLFEAEQERVAELQIINSIQQGLAAELDFQAIVDLVGDKLSEVLNTGTLVINWYDEKANLNHYLYAYEHGNRISIPPRKPHPGGMFETLIKTRKPLVFNNVDDYRKVNITLVPDTKQGKSYIAVPIISSDRVLGVITTENFEHENAFGESELRLLTTIAASLGTALENARLFDETQRLFKAEQERVAELQIINSIQQGLAAELDFQAIVDLVGDKLREVFKTPDLGIGWYDEKANLLHTLYSYEHGKRLTIGPYEPSPGGGFEMMAKTRQPLVLNTAEDYAKLNTSALPGTDQSKSLVTVPIISSDRVLGNIGIENYERENAYGESELRLLTTIAASLGTALENARLFDETQRLFKAEQERVAELQIINSIQQGLAAELDFQAIVDLVGDKLREVFNTPDLIISWYDEKANLLHYLYNYEHGNKLSTSPLPPASGGRFETIRKTRQPIIWKTQAEYVGGVIPGTDQSKSLVSVPIISSDRVLGLISIENYERENAFGESELRLLTTVSASLGTALENARLFRAEQERVAELQIINSIQQGLAAELDFQAIVDLVGDKLREVFDTGDLGITWYDEKSNLVNYLYTFEHGKRLEISSRPPTQGGMYEMEMKTRRPLVLNNATDFAKLNIPLLPGTDQSKSNVSVPIIGSDRFLGDISLDNYEHENAFGESELRLLTTIAASLGTALENARLFDETQRLFKAEQERVAELAIINSVQAGLASKLDMDSIYELVGDKIRDLFRNSDVVIGVYDSQTDMAKTAYAVEHGKRLEVPDFKVEGKGFLGALIRDPRTIFVNENLIEVAKQYNSVAVAGTDMPKSAVYVPMVIEQKMRGGIILENMQNEHAFSNSDVRLLETLANSMSVALENARLFKAEQERVAELQIINSIQQGLAAELDFQAIVDLVGDKLREVLNSGDIGIRWYDPKNDLLVSFYEYEHGERLQIPPSKSARLWEALSTTRRPIVFNTADTDIMKSLGLITIPGTDASKSGAYIPVIASDRAVGCIVTENFEREDAYGESELRLLTTVSASLGTALENARLFRAEQERVAELQIINSIQQGLAAELDFQAIVDLVGDKLREVFNTPDLTITWYDEKANLVHWLYAVEHGKRFNTLPTTPRKGGIYEAEMKTRKPVILNNADDYIKLASTPIPGTDQSKSGINVPIISSDRFLGDISIENYERENAFGESELRLLTTIAASLGTALENARLFDETQRLLKITEERNAELAIINSVQAALAAELNIQGIYDAVGDKIREIFSKANVGIRIYDPQTNLVHYPYYVESGQRISFDSEPMDDKGFGQHVIRTRETLVINENMAEEMAKYGSYNLPGTGMSKSILLVPMVVGDQARGLINLVDNEHEHAFSESDVRLLQTLANSMSVALENARLFNETQRLLKITEDRAAELAVINSVQQGLAAELNFQAIVDLVGDKLREVLKTNEIGIRWYDAQANLTHYLYEYEHGQRLTIPAAPPAKGGSFEEMLKTRQPVVINNDSDRAKLNIGVLPGTDPSKSSVSVPIIGSDRVVGSIIVEDYEKEYAYGESEIRLLTTVAASMGVALENARLFDETQRLFKSEQQRVAELQIINSVQQGVSSKLDFQAIIDLVGDKLREIFHTPDITIFWYDQKTNLSYLMYAYEHGVRLNPTPPAPPRSKAWHIMQQTRQPIVVNTPAEALELFGPALPGTDESRSMVRVPIIASDNIIGSISIENFEREYGFSESDVRLLQTVASSMGVALENARLFDETQRLLKETEERNAELAIINSVQAALAAELDIQGIYDAVGDKIRDIFRNTDMGIRIYDPKTNLIHFPYTYENGERITIDSMLLPDKGFAPYVLRTRETIVINENLLDEEKKYGSYTLPGTESEKATVFVPLVVGDQARGMINLISMEEHAFSNSDVRLLQTLANSMSVALENARLFDETQRLLKITEDRAAELSVINSIQQGLAAELNFQAIIDLVGDKLREVLNTGEIGIRWFDYEQKLVHYLYEYEHGQRLEIAPMPPKVTSWEVVTSRRAPRINNTEEEVSAAGVLPGTDTAKSNVAVDIIGSDRVVGGIIVENYEKEYAFGESEVRLLTTVASSMGVALENARLFDETQRLLKETEQRNAELALINGVQQGLASKLEIQAIIDLVGDKIRDVFDTQTTYIALHDKTSQTFHIPYYLHQGNRIAIEGNFPNDKGPTGHIIQTRETLWFNEDADQRTIELGSTSVADDDKPRSWLGVPMIAGDEVVGIVSLQNIERERAYSQSDVNLLRTIASSLAVALQNAQLFDETTRLLKETEQRNAELAIINSIQHGLASKLELQVIVDLVGEKLRGILNTDDIGIRLYDEGADIVHYLYEFEHGQRLTIPPTKPSALFRQQLIDQQPIFGSTVEISQKFNLPTVPGTEQSKGIAIIPIVAGSRVIGGIAVENFERDDYFNEANIRLMQTIASSMGVALENARLFDETQRLLKETEQRNAELAIINSVQAALAAELNIQGIYDAVGDKIREIFDQSDMGISIVDAKNNLLHFPYIYENGKRVEIDSIQLSEKGFNAHVIRTRQPLIVNENIVQEMEKYGSYILPGTQSEKSLVYVPMISGDQVRGIISLSNFVKEHAFSDSDVRLLQTLANSMSVALENARLFDETQRLLKETEQRAAELSIINSVQEGLAAKLDMRAIYDLVGDKIREPFSADHAYIVTLNREARRMHYEYSFDGKKKDWGWDIPLPQLTLRYFEESKQPLVINQNVWQEAPNVGFYHIKDYSKVFDENGDLLEVYQGKPPILYDKDFPIKSLLLAPLIINGQVRGGIGLENHTRENAFSESDVRLLQTLGNAMSIALENARLFDETTRLLKETEQRAAELAIINSVQEGLAAKLDMQAIYDLVGNKICEIFNLQTCFIMIYDKEHEIENYPFLVENDIRLLQEPIAHDEQGFGPLVMRTRQPVMINEKMQERSEEIGSYTIGGDESTEPKSAIYVPLLIGSEAKGVISVQNMQKENAFTDSDLRLLTTLASSMSVALESARLFNETEQHAAELTIINSVQEGLASKLEVQAIYDLVGEKLRRLFDTQAISLAEYDVKKNIRRYRYLYEKGQRFDVPDAPIAPLSEHIIRTRQPLLVNERLIESLNAIGITSQTVPGTEPTKSLLRVPILIGGEVRGIIGLDNVDHENAFTESDVRLLQTLAGSLSVALESARLFEETERRAGELTTINTVSSALASELDITALIRLVGEQARTVFRADIAYVALLDEATQRINFPYTYGEELTPLKYGEGLTGKIIETGKPLLLNEDVDQQSHEIGASVVGVLSQSYLGVPVFVRNRAVGVVSVQNTSQHNAFNENDQRLLTTIASNVGNALQNARLYKEAQESRAAAEQANKAKSTFLANMSHELRTPLNAIIGFTRIVRKKADNALPAKQLENLDKVLSSSEHLLGLINTVLDIAKIEAGRMDVIPANFSISSLMDQCANLATPLLKAGIKLEKQIDPNASLIYSDQDKIKQIVLNVLSNAAKFTHQGKITLAVRKRDDLLDISVTDTGIGITEEALGRIFEEFQQADTSTTRQYGGTGLGLAISRNLARLLGGDLVATSEYGNGSTFTLTIPTQYGRKPAASSDVQPDTVRTEESTSKTDSVKKRVLVIDDDPDAAYILQESLNQNEFTVLSAPNGHEGLQMARDGQPDAILLDILMPETDGWQVLNDLKSDQATVDIPVVLLTIVDKKALGFKLGAAAYLLKPLDPNVVIDALRRVIGEKDHPLKHVLVVDDDPHVAEMLRQSLPESDFALDAAEDGEAGMQAIETQRPDVILLDLMMPKLDGFGVIERLRANSELRNIPVIVISAKELTDDESKTLKQSVAFVMKKQGFDTDLLKDEINSVVKK